MNRRQFSFRTFTSFILAWTFLALVVSGAVLYVAPPGRIANWTNWQLLILRKEQWQAVHVLTAIMFLVGGIFHLLRFNWKPFFSYLKNRTGNCLKFRNEIVASTALFFVVVAGTMAQLQPFQSVMIASESIRETWEEPGGVPPIPHMEEMTLQQLAQNMQIENEKLIQMLEKQSLSTAGLEETLRQLARRTQTSPEQIYEYLKVGIQASAAEHQPAAIEAVAGRSQGFKTLAQLAAENGITLSNQHMHAA
jgi:hypothetical protein